jgi:cytochrome c peroxidase
MQVQKFSNNGLDATFSDNGRGGITGNPNDMGKFKVPTLRNIALTAPYMHDGRFATLDQVIEHYSSGINQSSTIDPLIEFAFQGGVQLDSEQKSLLKKFLETLTDHNFINNPNFKDPN